MDRWKGFSERQREALGWWYDPRYRGKEAIICDGAVRSGKTFSMGLGFFLWAMAGFSGEGFGLCGRSLAAVRRNILPGAREALVGLCPGCRAEALEERCPVCGAAVAGDVTGENGGFDMERFERLRRGEKA